MPKANIFLILGGIGSALVAILHVFIIYFGASAYRFFGAGEEMAIMRENGSLIPDLITAFIVIVFIGFSIYAFTAAKRLNRHLPFLKFGLIAIASIYLIRGLALPFLLIFTPEKIAPLILWSSLISLSFGLCYAIGYKLWIKQI